MLAVRKNRNKFEEVKIAFAEKGFDLPDQLYVNADKALHFTCSVHGTPAKLSYSSMKKGSTGCKKCTVEKRKKTTIDRFGGLPHEIPELVAKGKATNMAKRNVEFCSQDPEIKEKVAQTNLERYGVRNPLQSEEIKEKQRNTNMRVRGVDHISKDPVVQAKKIANNLIKYGYENPMQCPKVFSRKQKTSFSYKNFTFPRTGRKVRVQGFEDICLDHFCKTRKYRENDIKVGVEKVPVIYYRFENKPKTYFPDFFIKSKNIMVEVKSVYTMDLHRERNMAKFDAAVNAGYIMHVYVYKNKKIKYKLIIDSNNMVAKIY